MTPVQHHTGGPDRRDVPTLKGTVVLLGVLIGFLMLLSYPFTTIVLGTAAIASLLASKHVLPEFIARVRDETRRLTVPGIGTIEYRLTDR